MFVIFRLIQIGNSGQVATSVVTERPVSAISVRISCKCDANKPPRKKSIFARRGESFRRAAQSPGNSREGMQRDPCNKSLFTLRRS